MRAFSIRRFTVNDSDKLRKAWHSNYFAILLFSSLLLHPLRDPLQSRGVDVEPSWCGIGGLVPLAKPQSYQQVCDSQWHAQPCLSATSNKISPSSSTIDQAPHESQVVAWIVDVEVVVSELASKTAGTYGSKWQMSLLRYTKWEGLMLTTHSNTPLLSDIIPSLVSLNSSP